MSTVQLAVKKVKGMSDGQAQALLDWLAQQESRARVAKKAAAPRRNRKPKQTMADLMAWHEEALIAARDGAMVLHLRKQKGATVGARGK